MNSKEFYAKKLEMLAVAQVKCQVVLDAVNNISEFENEHVDCADTEVYAEISDELDDLIQTLMNEFAAVQAMVDA